MPQNVKEVQSFIGPACYCRQFIYHFIKKAWCLHELVDPTANNTMKKAWVKKKDEIVTINPELKKFAWMTKHQVVFDALKEAFNTPAVLGYLDLSKQFILETDASFNGLGTILSQQGKDGKLHSITYASHCLCPSERYIHNYSLVLALKWVVMRIFLDYSLGLWAQVYTDNNPHACVQDSKVGASEILWLSELALFNFTVKYWTGSYNKATDALNCHPFNLEFDNKSETDSG